MINITNITFLMLHLNYGGIEKQVTTLANNLCKNKDYNITIISVYDILGKSFYNLDPKINVKYLLNYGPNKVEIKNAFKSFNIFKLIKELFKGIKIIFLKYYLMNKEIKNIDTDIIVSSRIEFSKLIKKKDTFNITQEHSYITDNKYLLRFKNNIKYINKVVLMTSIAKELYSNYIDESKISVIGNIIESNDNNITKNNDIQSNNIKNNINKMNYDISYNINSKQILACGRLELEKRFDLLLKIFNKFVKKHPEYTLKIVGDGSLKNNLKSIVKDYNIESKVIFTGKLSKDLLFKEYMNSSIFCLTSDFESFSLVLGEAMSFKIPCISFNIDAGPKELIKDGFNGYLIENNNIDLYVDKLCLLVSDDNLRKNIGLNGSKFISKYNANIITSKWTDLFSERDNNE